MGSATDLEGKTLDATLTACEVWMSIVSTGVLIDAEAELEGAVVLPGAHIGRGAKMRNAIVAEKAVVFPDARIGYDTKSRSIPISCQSEGHRDCKWLRCWCLSTIPPFDNLKIGLALGYTGINAVAMLCWSAVLLTSNPKVMGRERSTFVEVAKRDQEICEAES
jgi:NDP-sugar pyrophosphorylase family protein